MAKKRTAQTIEESKLASHITSGNKSEKQRQTRSENGRKYGVPNLKPWKPGESGNPGGRPKNDLAREIAQAIFQNDAEAIYAAFAKALRSGNAYSFDVLANRAFGKLKETIAHEGLDVLAERMNKLRKQKHGDSDTKPSAT